MDYLRKRLRSLADDEMALLHLLYHIDDFKAIKKSRKVFLDNTESRKRFVWKSFYKFAEFELISLKLSGDFVRDMCCYEHVETLLLESEFKTQSTNSPFFPSNSNSLGFQLENGKIYRLKAGISEDDQVTIMISAE